MLFVNLLLNKWFLHLEYLLTFGLKHAKCGYKFSIHGAIGISTHSAVPISRQLPLIRPETLQ